MEKTVINAVIHTELRFLTWIFQASSTDSTVKRQLGRSRQLSYMTVEARGQPPLLQMVQVTPGTTNKHRHAQGCPATAMPRGEWKHFATAAAARSFPLDATSLFREQIPRVQGCSARVTAVLAAQRGRNGKQTSYYNYF